MICEFDRLKGVFAPQGFHPKFAFSLCQKDATNEDVKSAIKINLENAVHTALLLLPEQFNEFQLFSTLTALSYTGI